MGKTFFGEGKGSRLIVEEFTPRIEGKSASHMIIDEVATRFPVFVYGTLRKGFWNYERFLDGFTIREEKAKAKGVLYFAHGDAGFPAMWSDSVGEVVGELMYIDPDHYDRVIERLDVLEGVNLVEPKFSLYNRVVQDVVNESGEVVKAYVYIWNRLTAGDPIESGDWSESYKKWSVFAQESNE